MDRIGAGVAETHRMDKEEVRRGQEVNRSTGIPSHMAIWERIGTGTILWVIRGGLIQLLAGGHQMKAITLENPNLNFRPVQNQRSIVMLENQCYPALQYSGSR
jgi:hypothetical protein